METQTFPYRRLIVIGTTGSGKSTLAEQLSKRLELDFIELDAIYWLPNWGHRADDEFRARLEEVTRAPAWVIAGNYSSVRYVSWPRAEAIIWLDYPLWTIFWRLWHRTWRRWRAKELLWGTNYEKLWPHFKIWSAEDSLFHWLFKTYWRHKREYPKLFNQPEYSHLKVFHFQSPEETDIWLANL